MTVSCPLYESQSRFQTILHSSLGGVTKNTLLPVFCGGISQVLIQAKNMMPIALSGPITEAFKQKSFYILQSFSITEAINWLFSSNTISTLKTSAWTYSKSSTCLVMAAWGITAHVIYNILSYTRLKESTYSKLSCLLSTAVILSAAIYNGTYINEMAEVGLLSLGVGLICSKLLFMMTPKFCIHKWRVNVREFDTRGVYLFRKQNKLEYLVVGCGRELKGPINYRGSIENTIDRLKTSNIGFNKSGVPHFSAHAKSRIDDRAEIDDFKWAATLIRYKGCANNHAEMILEKIKKRGEYAMRLIHFEGPDIKIKKINPPYKVKLVERSPVFLVSSAKARKMYASVKYDKKHLPSFSYFGGTRFAIGEHNCFTWLRGKFEMMNLPVKDHFIDNIIALTSNHMHDYDDEIMEKAFYDHALTGEVYPYLTVTGDPYKYFFRRSKDAGCAII